MCLLGCSANKQSSSAVSTAEGGYDQALAAFESGDFQTAENQLTRAIDADGLNPDLVAEAFLLRAESRSRLGKLDDALADLAIVEQAVPDVARFQRVRGEILLAQGDTAGARDAYSKAREVDGTIALPDELK